MISSRSLRLFQRAAVDIAAYKQFLNDNHVDASKIQTLKDFNKIPFTSKKSYLNHFSRTQLIWPELMQAPLWFCSTSGSTGEPYYFPRVDELAERGSRFIEEYLNYSSYGKGRTLVLIALGMGVWIGGIITLRSFEIAATRSKLPVSFLPTGYNKVEILKALRKLSPDFDQTIIVGYPPFIKEVIDEAISSGIDLKSLHLRLMFAAESFTESFRKYVCEQAGIPNSLFDTLNIYGSADMGAMAFETPLSILIRRLALENPLLYKELFGQIAKTPTLAQFNQKLIDFEAIEGQLYITSNGAMPLIRYAIGDHGGVLRYLKIVRLFARYNIDLTYEIKLAGIQNTVKTHPFVYVYERVDLSASLHGIIIYPEFIKEALHSQEISTYFTGRFVMSTKHDIRHNQFLQVNIELRNDIIPSKSLEEIAIKTITKMLITKSSEFAEISKNKSRKKLVRVLIWPKDHSRHFPSGAKHKWVKQA